MRLPRRRTAVSFLLLLAPAPRAASQAVAPSPEFVRENWTVADGLPINTITSIVQTRDGYLWLGTNDGVVRFDGVRFTVFNAGNTADLPSNRIVSLLEDRAGALWIITEQGHLVRYHRGRFTNFDAAHGLRRTAVRVTEMSDGTVVLATSRGAGILEGDRFIPVADTLTADPAELVESAGGAVRRRDGSMWIATQRHGVWRMAKGRLEDVTPPGLRGVNLLSVALDGHDRLWVSGRTAVWMSDGSFKEVRRSDGSIEYVHAFRFDERGGRTWLLSRNGVDVVTGTAARNVTAFAVTGGPLYSSTLTLDSTGVAWYANGTELFRDGRRVLALEGRPGDNDEPRAITSVTIDREGSVWLGTRASGVYRLKPSLFTVISVPEGLPVGNVYPVYEDPWGSIWVGSFGKGVSRIDSSGEHVTTFPPSAASPSPQANAYPELPRDFFSDRPDRMWVASLNGILSCTLPAFRCTRDSSSALANDLQVHALYADAQGRLWAGAQDGVLRHQNGHWERVAGWPLTGIQVRAFTNTSDGALWIATGGRGIVRHKDGHFARVSIADGLPSDVVRALHVDADGYLWIGTEGRGLARLDPRAWADSTRSRRIVHIGTADGLYDDAIHRILADDADRLWMNSNRGIFWVPRSELVAFAEGRTNEVHSTSYTERDGMRNREGNGGVGSAGTRTRDGRLWFPTQDGIAIVDPRVVTARRVTPAVVVERVVAGDSVIVPSGAPIEIGVRNRNLTIEYTALSLLEPKNLRFRYRLEPYDAAWVDAGNRRTAFYTRVPPGSYTFRVQAASPDAEFASLGGELHLSLAFQAWETRTFRLGAIVLLLAAAAGGAVLYTRRVRQRSAQLELVVAERTATLREREQQLALQNEQLSELDRAKSRFFANVSHEFRTPLTLTIGPLEGVMSKLTGVDGSVARALDMALRNARRLMRLVNQILDVAKLEAGHMRLSRRPLDLAAFVRGIAEAFVPAATGKGIALEIEAPSSLRGAFDSDALERVVTNLLSNAVKFTPGGGRVMLSLWESDVGVTMRVADTGPGIPAAHLPHVFERFYQVDESLTRSEAGTGIGLALVQELVTLHGGTITVSSGDLAPGAVFTVTLPLGEIDANTDESRAILVDGTEPERLRSSTPNGAENGVEPDNDDAPALLIVDDSADLRAYVRDHFAARYRVLEAENGAEGIEIARRELPDVVVSDLLMPGTDGHALVGALRASPETDFLPIILLTAHTAMDQRLAGLAGGADDYLTKPFDMRELAARVNNLIAQRRRLRERFVAAPSPPPANATEPSLSQPDRAFMDKVEAAIGQHLVDPEFGVSELARAAAQERTYLFRRTRQLFGESPSDLIRRMRLQRGATLLAETEERVADIAYAAGFNSVSYFSRCFLAAYGVTPSSFRERSRSH